MAFFSGFTKHRIRTSGATINAVSAGSGEPVLQENSIFTF